MKNKLLFILFLTIITSKTFSQEQKHRLYIGLNLNGTTYLFQSKLNPALQFWVGYEIRDKVGVYASYVQHNTANGDFKATVVRLAATPRAVGKYNSRFSVYFPVGISVLSMKEYIAKDIYKHTGYTIDLGAGFEAGSTRVKFFTEVGAGLPMTKYNAGTLFSGYGSIHGNLGMKFSL